MVTTAVLLYASTGGGHLSAARALLEGFEDIEPEVDVALIDFVDSYTSAVVRALPPFYSFASRHPLIWRSWYATAAGRRRAAAANASLEWGARKGFRRLFEENVADVYVSLHPTANRPLVRALRRFGPPGATFATVVTDISAMSPLWFCPEVDLCLVPSPTVREQALLNGLKESCVVVAGFPVSRRYSRPTIPAAQHSPRADLGLPTDCPIVLVSGGGEGCGPLESVVRDLAHAGRRLSIVVVTGRNARAARRLRSQRWPCHVRVLGLVPDMSPWMQAADVFVTKAGPGALHEGAAVGLPMVIFHRLPGQESGNADIFADAGAGICADRPAETVAHVLRILDSADTRQRMARAGRRMVDPSTPAGIARALVALADRGTAGRGGID